MKVLIPLLGENDNEEFILQAAQKAKEIVILLIVENTPNQKFGFTTSQISKGEKLIEETKNKISKKKKVEDIIEWGDPSTKIINTALLKKVDKIIMKTQHNQLFEELVEKIKKEKIELELI
ncbi:MAG: universal stress protein [Candidatus Diapherotrites archaeon]